MVGTTCEGSICSMVGLDVGEGAELGLPRFRVGEAAGAHEDLELERLAVLVEEPLRFGRVEGRQRGIGVVER